MFVHTPGRRMKSLKGDTRNMAHPEGSICEQYLNLEVINFCTLYFGDEIDWYVSSRSSRNEVRKGPTISNRLSIFEPTGEALGGRRQQHHDMLTSEEYEQAYMYVLQNCDEVDPYMEAFDREFCGGCCSYEEVQQVRKVAFVGWFRTRILGNGSSALHEDIVALARGPDNAVVHYIGYTVNGYRFHTESYGATKRTYNSGVCVKGTVVGNREATDFYGILQDVIEVRFTRQTVVLFKCHWFDTSSRRNCWTHRKFGLVEINPTAVYPYPEPFVLASQASQVYYAPIPNARRRSSRKNWWAVFHTRARHVIDGLTEMRTVGQSDNESDVAEAADAVYQDNDIPPVPDEVADDDLFDEGLQLHTGNYVEVDGRIQLEPALEPTQDDLLAIDDEPEEHDSD